MFAGDELLLFSFEFARETLVASHFASLLERMTHSTRLTCVRTADKKSPQHGSFAGPEIDKSHWPENLEKDIAPLWDEIHGDRQQEIVIIGQSLNKDEITQALNKCLISEEEMKGGQEAWDHICSQIEDPFQADWDAAIELAQNEMHDHGHDHNHGHSHHHDESCKGDHGHSHDHSHGEICGDDNCSDERTHRLSLSDSFSS